MTTLEILERAKEAKLSLSSLTTDKKRSALLAMANEIEKNTSNIITANALDMDLAKDSISPVMLDRLYLNEKRIKNMAEGIRAVAKLEDPVGKILSEHTREDGLVIKKISVPIGVVAIIYESRPNVTSDAAALAIMSGNVCVLRTGKEAHRTAQAIVDAMQRGVESVGLNKNLINLIGDTSRASATELMTAVGYVDLLIPRGGAGLIRSCVENAKVPCIQTGTGICHIYVDETADLQMALNVIENAKCSRPSVCNAMEVCLVNEKISKEFIPLLWERLVQKRAVDPILLHVERDILQILKDKENVVEASCGDFDKEFLAYEMAVAIVKDVHGAIAHVAKHSTGHSESIITSNEENANAFLTAVDSAAVYVNASTRFTDGGEFGLGCEMGISTQKLHARGPMGLNELTTYKYVIIGNGHIR